ncbi:MAG: hypothetical protein U9R75_12170, partial [Candidatus Thermoplasmatota archaeon]|nr:hypothetical protein [Candidatus Thermoplasmatota archaeon]
IYIELKYSTSWDLLNWTGPERLLDHDMEKSLSNPEIRCMPNGRIFVVADYVEYPVHNGYYPSQIYLMEVQGDVDSDGHDFRTDRFPEDPAASKDSDLDGYPDEWNEGSSGENSTTGLRLDEFPDDPKEWIDRDEDGYGDNEDDRFPEDGSEWNDTDNDGCGDNSDEFPGNGYEWEDRDNDGRGDNMEDAFPNDPKEWHDTDGDMVGDNSDRFPYNYSEWEDSDLDGTGDNGDAFPLDRAASIDTDGDGYPDSWNPGMNERDTSTLLEIDSYPDDPERWEGADKGGSFSMILVWVLIVILVIVLIGEIVSFVAYKHIKRRRKDNTAIYGWKRQQGVNDFGKKEGEKKAF